MRLHLNPINARRNQSTRAAKEVGGSDSLCVRSLYIGLVSCGLECDDDDQQAVVLYVGFFLSVVSRTEAQAPGDGDPICTEEVVNGMMSPYFAIRPAYSPNQRPLIDSRDYVGLLQGGDIPWQSIDIDNNNTAGVATAVSVELETRNR